MTKQTNKQNLNKYYRSHMRTQVSDLGLKRQTDAFTTLF